MAQVSFCAEINETKISFNFFLVTAYHIHKGGEQMGLNGMGGPDMNKMLQMMMPYMDPSTKRMMNIMMKLQELKTLMQPPQNDKKEAVQPQKEESAADEEMSSGTDWDPAVMLRDMDNRGRAGKSKDLAAALQEGLTPEQKSMITSLSGMLR